MGGVKRWEPSFQSPVKTQAIEGGSQHKLLSKEHSPYENPSQEAEGTGINTPASLGLPGEIEDAHSLSFG